MDYPIYRLNYSSAQIGAWVGKAARVGADGSWETWDIASSSWISTEVRASGRWFAGTEVSGSGASISVEVAGTQVGDMYLNTANLNIYLCIAADTWSYETQISGSSGMVSYSPQLPTAEEAQVARHNIRAPYWLSETVSGRPQAADSLVWLVEDAEAGRPESLIFAADSPTFPTYENDGVYKLYGAVIERNQHAPLFANSTSTSARWRGLNGVSMTLANNNKTVTLSGAAYPIYTTNGTFSAPANHKWLMHGWFEAANFNSTGNIRLCVAANYDTYAWYVDFNSDSGSSGQFEKVGVITAGSKVIHARANVAVSTSTSLTIKDLIVVDLTQMFGAGQEPSTYAEFAELCKNQGIDETEFETFSTGVDKVRYTFDFTADAIPAGTTRDVVGSENFYLTKGRNQLWISDALAVNQSVTLTYPRDLGIVINRLEKAIVVINSNN